MKDQKVVWESSNMYNSYSNQSIIYINSNNTTMNNALTWSGIEKKIWSEYSFFDQSYFKKKSKATIEIFFFGEGDPEGIPVAGDLKVLPYRHLIKSIANSGRIQAKNIESENLLNWRVVLNIDICYSGSCITEAKKWA